MVQTHHIQAHRLLCGPGPRRPGPLPVCSPEIGELCDTGLREINLVIFTESLCMFIALDEVMSAEGLYPKETM